MADERSTFLTHEKNSDQKSYDENYYLALGQHIHGDVLDIGCGIGMFSQVYANNHNVNSVLGIDKIDNNNQILRHPKFTYSKVNIPNELQYVHGKFDTIVATEFIEHISIETFFKVLEFAKTHLRDDSSVFCGSTPIKLQPTQNPYHLHEFVEKELQEYLIGHFKDVEITNIGRGCMIFFARKPV